MPGKNGRQTKMDTAVVFTTLNVVGLFVFAISGALTALRKDLDILAVVMIAFFTGVGGGTIRDITLGSFPVWWIKDPFAIAVCLAGAVVATIAQPILASRLKALIWADAMGLSVFAVLGAQAALAANAPAIVAVFMGAVTATFGGIIRDVLLSQPSLIMKQEIYATAALTGAGVYVGLAALEVPYGAAAVTAVLTAFLIRGAAILFNMTAPKFGGPRK